MAVAAVALAAAVLAPSADAGRKPRATPDTRITFSSIPWLMPADSAARLLEARGYRGTTAEAEDAGLAAAGRLFDRDALVLGWLDEQDHLLRWMVTIRAEEKPDVYADVYTEMRRVYDEAVVEAESKYGARERWAERFLFPYEKGDGRETDALREGDAVIRSVWTDREGDRLTIEMARRGDVVLTYECPGWSALQTRVRQRKGRDL
jgi:hypothetical protein